MIQTAIIICKCHNPGQDRLHGRGKRIHNYASRADGRGGWRCTVCLDVKSVTKAPIKMEEVNADG